MYVVTTVAGDERAGCLVGFVTQCSIRPPRFLVCLSKSNRTYAVALRAEVLAVHLLDANAMATVRLFGEQTGDEVDKFARCSWSAGPERVPILDDAYGWFAGRLLSHVDGGDHDVFLLEPIAGESRRKGTPVMFQQVKDLEPGHPA
ncbi:MAG: flavin reductase family protein [Mycobacteriales bacterium]